MKTVCKIFAMSAATVALVGGLAAPASARVTDPDTLPTLPTSEDCRVVRQGQFSYQVQCRHILRTYVWSPSAGQYVQRSIRWVR